MRTAGGGEPGAAISVDGLGRSFGSRVAVEGLRFEVRAGEIFGLLGPNGAGKTTTVRMLAGLLTPSGGRARVAGVPIPLVGGLSGAAATALRGRIGLLTEQPGLYERLTARENLAFFARLYELDLAAAWERARRLLARFDLDGRFDEPVGGLSKGMRQKLAVVRALLHEPQVLFLDEPTSGLDPQSARVVRDTIAELAAEGRAVVLCSHNLAEVEQLCTRVAVVKGRQRVEASLAELKGDGLAFDVRVDGDAAPFAALLQARGVTGDAAVTASAATEAEAVRPRLRVTSQGSHLRVSVVDEALVPDFVATLVRAGARIHTVARATRPLEDAYLELVREEDEP